MLSWGFGIGGAVADAASYGQELERGLVRGHGQVEPRKQHRAVGLSVGVGGWPRPHLDVSCW